MEALTPRKQYLKRLESLRNERSSWMPHWQELTEQFMPRRGRFVLSDRNRGEKKNQTIINGTGVWSLRVLASGMMAGITSPARPWFRLTTPDPDLAEFGTVKQWTYIAEERIRLAFQRSNIYNGLHLVYNDLGGIGTATLHVEEDAEDLLRCYVFPVGQYSLANSAKQRVDTVFREFSMTVGQLVERFGLGRCSHLVKTAYQNGNLDQWVEVVHAIEPNRGKKHGYAGAAGMPFKSCWFEKAGDESSGFLRESGFEEFPVMAPRWMASAEDVYGSSPSMDALGDARALQVLEKRKAQAVDKIVTPPMRGPSSLATGNVSLLPGGVTLVDGVNPGQTFAPAMEVPPATVQVVGMEIREHEQRIKKALYADLWLMLSQGDTSQMTAREVAERHEEKMLQLGPVMERLQDELLDPLIDRTFGILNRNGYLPPPPEELQGQELRVEYISILAQAQKLLGTSSIERLASFTGNLAAVKPEVLDKVDFDQMVDEYGGMLGIPPSLVRTDEQVQAIRQARAEQQQQMMAMQAAQQTVQGAKVLSETDVSGDNALTRMLRNIGGTAFTGRGR